MCALDSVKTAHLFRTLLICIFKCRECVNLCNVIKGLVSTTFTLEQKSGFKLERNKDLTFIVIIIDID